MFSKRNNLYVLRYNKSGNYYVGTTKNFEKRMLDHWRKTSKSPKWSQKNTSTNGFKFYWFNINGNGVSRSEADICENRMAEKLFEIISKKNNEKFIKEIHVGNGSHYDVNIPVEDYNYSGKDKDENTLNDIDKEIMEYLKKAETLRVGEKNISIKCWRIGYIGEFHQNKCNKSLIEVVSFFEQ